MKVLAALFILFYFVLQVVIDHNEQSWGPSLMATDEQPNQMLCVF